MNHFDTLKTISWDNRPKNAIKWGSAHPRDPIIASWWGGSNTVSGAYVTPDTALQVAAVYACVNVLSQSLAMLPLILYKQGTDGTKTRDLSNYLYKVLYCKPNRWQTSFEWRWMMMGHLLLRGNAYSEIISSPGRGVSQLIPLHPDRVTPFWVDQEKGLLAYQYQPAQGEGRIILQEEMFHIRNLSLDGLKGLTPISLHREGIALSMVTLEHGARVFSNGAQVGGVLQHPGQLGDKAYERLRKDWEDRHSGVAKAHKTAILEEGMTFQRLALTNEDAQYLETRKLQRSEIASIYRVPPHMIGDLEKASFSNIEQQSLEFVIFTMMPWFTCWEQAIQRDILNDDDARFARFMMQALLRGDTPSRYTAYAQGRQWGFLSANDCRRLEDMDPVEGGDIYLTPMNMVPAGTDPALYLSKGAQTGENPPATQK